MSTLEEKIMHTLESTNQRLSLLLWVRREMKIEGVLGPCKGCGWPHATVSYTYVEEGVTERVCHDCAWPKNGDYLKEKEEKREKEQAKKEKREYAEKWLDYHMDGAK